MTERWPARTLVGREDELGALVAALETVRQGRMATVFLTGDAGVGKTRLVQELVRRADGAGATVLLGAASDIAESPPFWPVASALRAVLRSAAGEPIRRLLAPWSEQLDELLALRAPVPAALGRVQTLELLHRVVLRLATESVVVLVVEDVQWADRSTLDLLAYLVADLPDERLLLVGTHRSEPGAEATAARTMIRELGRHRQVRSIELAPLRRTDIAELVRADAPDRPDLVDLVWTRSAGNAFIAEETLRAALDGDPTALPTTLRELVLSRVGRLTPPALRAVRAVGLCEGPLPHRLLDAVLGDDPSAGSWLLDALREAVDAGVVVVDGAADGYRLRHGLMTEVVVGELLPGERMDLHRRYATALSRSWARELPGVDARLAHHWYGAGDRERAGAAAVAAAEAADRVRGYAEAHRHWLRAAQLAGELDGAPVPRTTCLERAAEAAHLAGDADQAVALLAERLDLLEPVGAPDTGPDTGPDAAPAAAPDDLAAALLHARTGRYLVAAGRGGEAAEAFGRATAALPAAGAEPERAEVLGGYAGALWTAGDYAGAHEAAGRALTSARRAGLAVEEARALATLGFSLAYREDAQAGEAALRESIAVAERAGEPTGIVSAHRRLAELLSGPLNELDRGIAIARAGVERARELGLARSAGAGLLALAANGMFRIGRWDEADATIAEAWELAPRGAEALELRLSRARLHTGRGRFDAAEDDLEAVEALSAATVGPRYRLPLLTLRAGLAMWQGRPDVALDHVATGLDVVEQGSDDVWLVAPLVWHGARARAELTRLGMRRADDATVARLRRHADELARTAASSVPAVRDVVLGFVAMSAAEDGRAAQRSDPQAWEHVAEVWRVHRQPYPAAYAHLRRAEALLSTRARSGAAAESLRHAAGVARDLAAGPFLAEVAELAERARVRLDGVGRAPEPAQPPATPAPDDELAALTARELEVLTELAGGHTNREIAQRLFISEKTVGVHVGRIYAKIGVHSRVQASAVLFRARPEARPGAR
ncbi:helix-turn-helix transcriptional regulator [Pseudonocardia kunmingensis]|uniref:Regulatory LuxR family protein n=1 Tax=Pseudonocardia kunmingensis TaxID=630975 RepID=A0A543DYJ3_9PSEU|nr:LuxR family transcriptional regulator [Pseudonocardia kunmingensis]TQM14403.1 regulatory LuxR family protein [Pseudonocardia kunmingensis]